MLWTECRSFARQQALSRPFIQLLTLCALKEEQMIKQHNCVSPSINVRNWSEGNKCGTLQWKDYEEDFFNVRLCFLDQGYKVHPVFFISQNDQRVTPWSGGHGFGNELCPKTHHFQPIIQYGRNAVESMVTSVLQCLVSQRAFLSET